MPNFKVTRVMSIVKIVLYENNSLLLAKDCNHSNSHVNVMLIGQSVCLSDGRQCQL